MGGDCLNYGCVPSKALLAAGPCRRGAAACRPLRRRASAPAIDFRAVHAHVHGVIAAIAPHDSEERFERPRRARAARAGALHRPARGRRRRCPHPRPPLRHRHRLDARCVPPLPGLEHVPYLTNETIFDLIEAAAPPAGHRRRPDRRRAGAGLPPPGRRGLARRDGDAAAEGRSGAGRRSCASACTTKASRSTSARGDRCRVGVGWRRPAHASLDGNKGRASTAATCWSPPAAAPTSPASISTQPASPHTPTGITVDCQSAHQQPPRLRHRRRRRRPAIHPSRRLSRGHRDPPRPVPPAGARRYRG